MSVADDHRHRHERPAGYSSAESRLLRSLHTGTQDSAVAGSLVISDLVYAELCVHFATQDECDDFLGTNEIRVEALSRASHFAASRVWRQYRKQGGTRARILADFLVGAHAQVQASRLVTRDRGFYKSLFPSLSLIDPSGHNQRAETL